jgi:restriction endonuclease S subunit
MNLSSTAARKLALPPVVEQEAIVEYLSQESRQFDSLVRQIGEAIECLLEMRTSLVSAAVTGKIDVREEVA